MFPPTKTAEILNGRLLRGTDEVLRRATHDSRLVQRGDLFVALRGEHTDGHRFLEEAFARGAGGAIVSNVRAIPENGRNLIVVENTLRALQTLARAWRRKLNATMVGITGTCGKTTTKGLLAHLLSSDRETYVAPESYNTEIGLPLALLSMPVEAQIGVFELGVGAPGEMTPLAELLSPHVVILTMVGRGHLQGFGSVEVAAEEKWNLVRALPQMGTAIVNVDCPSLGGRVTAWEGDALTFGLKSGNLRGKVVEAFQGLIVEIDDPPLRLESRLLGRHQAVPLLAAVAGALRLGVSLETVGQRVKTFDGPPHRLRLLLAPFGYVLDDSYNANPDSTTAALRTLVELDLPVETRAFVFGSMFELGEKSPGFHREVLEFAVELGVAPIYPVGEQAMAAVEGVLDRLLPGTIVSASREELADRIGETLEGKASLLLVKGSHLLGLDRLVEALCTAVP
jgi:UDP-N-acetylmuramoyl-tripeptide--D-alanyl-D-alanine ligase